MLPAALPFVVVLAACAPANVPPPSSPQLVSAGAASPAADGAEGAKGAPGEDEPGHGDRGTKAPGDGDGHDGPAKPPGKNDGPAAGDQQPPDGHQGGADDKPKPPAGGEPPHDEPGPATPPVVTLSELKFVGGGEVPDAAGQLDKTRAGVAACVAEHGGLAESSGELKMQLLVRLRGRAEGVEVLGARAVGEAAGRCVRKLLKHRHLGTPTADPVGIMFRYRLSKAP